MRPLADPESYRQRANRAPAGSPTGDDAGIAASSAEEVPRNATAIQSEVMRVPEG